MTISINHIRISKEHGSTQCKEKTIISSCIFIKEWCLWWMCTRAREILLETPIRLVYVVERNGNFILNLKFKSPSKTQSGFHHPVSVWLPCIAECVMPTVFRLSTRSCRYVVVDFRKSACNVTWACLFRNGACTVQFRENIIK